MSDTRRKLTIVAWSPDGVRVVHVEEHEEDAEQRALEMTAMYAEGDKDNWQMLPGWVRVNIEVCP